MTSPRPSYHRSAAYSQRDDRSYEDKEKVSRHYLPVQDQYPRPRRLKSPARVGQAHTSNCGRRRWPPSPKVEEVKCEEQIPMRGKIGQDPMIIDLSYPTSNDSGSTYSRDSNYGSEPETPSASESDNPDRRYVWKPKPDIPIPQAYDKTDNAKYTQQENTVSVPDRDRGRKAMHKLDTDLVPNESRGGPSPLSERARSPYASGPQARKPKPDRFSGEYLLSPDIMSPRRTYAQSPGSQSQYFPRPAESHTNGRPAEGKDGPRQPVRLSMENQRSHSHYVPRPVEVHNSGKGTQGRNSPRVSVRPSMERCASELPYPSDCPQATKRTNQDWNTHRWSGHQSMNGPASETPYPVTPTLADEVRPRSRRPGGHYHDSDSGHGKAGGKSGGASPQNPPLHQTTRLSSELPASQPRRSVPLLDSDGPPVNLSSLVSGAAIQQTLAAMLNGDHIQGRRASPRPSPQPSPGVSPLPSPRGSPKTSPYSSPPRTPPSESHHYQAKPITGLKKESPISRPSSPLSSRSSTWTMEPDRNPSDSDQGRKSRPAPLKSRRTAPLPSPKIEEPGESEPSTPGVYVRSPSPARHVKPLLSESVEPQHSRTGPKPALSAEPSQPTTLKPMGLSGRPRSASSADVRPQLTVNPAPFSQGFDSSSSPRSGSRARSPSVVSPGDRYKPPKMEPTFPAVKSSLPQPDLAPSITRSRSRSRSDVPKYSQATPMRHATTLNATAPAPRSGSIVPTLGSVDSRSPSSAPKPMIPASPPMQLTVLPSCPRPHSVTGYGDWYTLNQSKAFIICPSCRDNVFGYTYEQYLQPRPVSSSRKTLCDLNNPWIRLACLLHGPDVKLLSALSEVTTRERACPGDELAPRDWYRLEDPDNGKHISGVNVCPHCVHSLEVLFPHWRDVLYRAHTSSHHESKERFCSLRSSGIRFGDYLDMIVESSREAGSRRKPPNTKPVCDLAKQLAAIDECPRDKMNPRKAWHVHPHLPEFTICQDCYETVVYPLVKTGSPLAAKIDKKPQQFPNPDVKCCCNLYSPKMRKVFREACEDDDYEHLRHTVLRRHMLQQDLLETLGEKEEHPRDDEITDRLQELVSKWKDKE